MISDTIIILTNSTVVQGVDFYKCHFQGEFDPSKTVDVVFKNCTFVDCTGLDTIYVPQNLGE